MIGKNFDNIKSYNEEMAKEKVMNDKLFFLDEIEQDKQFGLIVDFGCADGTLISKLYERHKSYLYIGYDASKEMIDLAKTKFEYPDARNVTFTDNWTEVESVLVDLTMNSGKKKGKILLVLSSVIHEVYSYAKSEDEIKEFWKRTLNNSMFDYIAIRDMMPSEDIDRTSDLKFKANYAKLSEIRNKIYNGVRSDLNDNPTKKSLSYKEMLKEFEDIWGSIANNKNLVHFLLKYKWIINWNREVHENYFPFYIEEMNSRIKYSNYNTVYFKRFCPLKDSVKKTFGIDMIDDTHVKYILKLKNKI